MPYVGNEGPDQHTHRHSTIWAQLFKTNDVISYHIKTLIIKYGMYANMFAKKCE